MDCLKCPNFWKTDIDENQCDFCGVSVDRPENENKED